MERESFEDEEVAAILNAHFVAVKVDREERPDVDHIYMSVCQALTGSGGWPLTVVLAPDRRPFFAGTYFPKRSKWGRPGLVELLENIANAWAKDRGKLVAQAGEIAGILSETAAPAPQEAAFGDLLAASYHQLADAFDPQYGGFGAAPKFPTPHNLLFLLRYWHLTGAAHALAMADKTLAAMSAGGIRDHLGGGFARYSTDDRWLVPHFEKMLYDNALLCHAYLEAYQCTGNPAHAGVAEEILAYVKRDLTSEDGAFLSAEDADSEGVEGKFYVWSREEILALLGDDGDLFAECYGVTAGGNFEHANILNLIGRDLDAAAARRGLARADLDARLAACRQKLFTVREQRAHPFKDDKILTAWNGLMIAACAKAARVLGKPAYAAAAERACRFILDKMVRADGRLLARYRDGEAAIPAYLEDYAFLLWGLLELFETGQDPDLLAVADRLAAAMLRLFGDDREGGFYYYGCDGEQLITRPKELYDGALPSGNSAAAFGLLRLARITGSDAYAAAAEKTLAAFSGQVARQPRAYTFYLCALAGLLAAPRHIVLAGRHDDPELAAMRSEAGRRFAPETIVILAPDGREQPAAAIPLLAGKPAVAGRATAYICENFACRRPINSLDEFRRALGEKAPPPPQPTPR
jgi:uncharacterized protein YyaL (SSP411 family)